MSRRRGTALEDPSSLPRSFGAWTGVAVVVGITVGSGIFLVPAAVAAGTGNASGVALVWVLGGLISLCGVLSIAELAAMYPRSGGPYVYLLEAYGKPVAFLAGWVWLITTPIAWAAKGLAFAEYLASLVSLGPIAMHLTAAALILLLGAGQYRSVRVGARLQNIATAANMAAVLGLTGAIFALGPRAHGVQSVRFFEGSITWRGIGAGLVVALWAYDGWENLTTLAGEIRHPRKSLPAALIGGTLAVMAVYLLLNAAYLHALPFAALAHSRAVASDAATAVLGSIGAAVGAALVMIAVVGSLNASIMSDSRVLFAMAEDQLFFRPMAWVHPRFKTPYVAIAFLLGVSLILVMLRSFLELAESYVLGVWPLLAFAVVGIFVLRRKEPHALRPYKTLGYPIVPALFVLGTFGIVVFALYHMPVSTSVSIGVTLLGLPVYWLWESRKKKRALAAQELLKCRPL